MLTLLLLLQATAADSTPPTPIHDARHYEVTLVPADTGTHLLGETQIGWRLRSGEPVGARLDSAMRVVRVLVDGRPNTRLSRTMFGRSGRDVVVPHQKQAGDTISTRMRYHGPAGGGAWLGQDRSGARAFVAGGWAGSTGWLPVPAGPAQRVTAAFNVQAPLGQRVIANGTLIRIDTLPYGDATWHYRLDSAVPIPALAVAAGRYTVVRPADRVEVWARPADSAWAAGGPFRQAGALLERLTRTLGPYPYERLVHVATTGFPGAVSGGGLALYPEDGFRDGGVDQRAIARATARQWLDGADPALADEIAGWLAAEPDTGRLAELRRRLGDGAFRRGLRAFAESQRRGKGSAADFDAAMQARE